MDRGLQLRSWCFCSHRAYDHAKMGTGACDLCSCVEYDDVPEMAIHIVAQEAIRSWGMQHA